MNYVAAWAMLGLGACVSILEDFEDGDAGPLDAEVSETDAAPFRSDNAFAVIITDEALFPTHRSVDGVPCTRPSDYGCNPCATERNGPHGADIDAVGLFAGDTLRGYLIGLNYEPGDLCYGDRANTATNMFEAMGPPDGTATTGFVSLGGGWLAGEFGDESLQIAAGDSIVIYEVDTGCPGHEACPSDERYEIFVASDARCPYAAGGYPWPSCAQSLGVFAGEATVVVSAF